MPITKATASSIAPAAKGDLVVGSATNDASVLAVGSANQVLTVDSSTSTGLKWAAASSGGMTLLSTTTMSGTSTTVSGIDTSYNKLVIQILDFYPSSAAALYFRLNSDSTANAYRYIEQQGDSGAPYPTGTSQWFFNANAFYFDATQKAADSNAFAWIELPNYADTSTHKFARFHSGWLNNGDNEQVIFGHGYWKNTSAVTSILFSNNGVSASQGTIKIWGVK